MNNKNNANNTNVFVVIPAYNESKVIKNMVQRVFEAVYKNVIVVDDGSTDQTLKKAREAGALAFRHRINRGKGAATKTGIELAKKAGADVIVTLDGDGQHEPKDIPTLIEPILNDRCDVVLGSRFVEAQDIPILKRFYNRAANLLTTLLYGIRVSDSQSGFRAYSRYAADLINTKGDKYEFESEVIHEITRHSLRYEERPITVYYTEYSQSKPMRQTFIRGVQTVYKMLWRIVH